MKKFFGQFYYVTQKNNSKMEDLADKEWKKINNYIHLGVKILQLI